jgi:cell wall-associated NlpC family hydrolase
MARYSAEQIYGFCRMAGFSPDEAATFTAIALAESGGNSQAHNPIGEDSKGLFQINARAHPGLDSKYNLYDPQQNARAAFEVSRGGSDASPWTVTHGSSRARYLMYKDEAQAAAVAYGDPAGLGVWTGTPGYGHPLDAGSDEGAGVGVHAMTAPTAQAGTNTSLTRFLEVAQAQVGDRYVFGAEVKNLDDPNPDAFDCSELTQWAAHQAGVTIPDGAAGQYRYFQKMGLLIPVEEAKNTPGALLFHFASDPVGGKGEPPVAHVAISVGDGRTTIEAKNSRAGVVNGEVGTNRFNYAAIIPGISDGNPTALATAPAATAAAPEIAQVALGGMDSDHDGLTDALERRMGLDPLRSDTDGDNLADGHELVTSLTNPRRADTDGDGLNDAFELARGLDPLSPDTDRDGHLDGAFGQNAADSDLDGLDDALEMNLGLNPQLVDSDNDGYGDALELHSNADPLDGQVNPIKLLAAARQSTVDPADGGLDDDPSPVVH